MFFSLRMLLNYGFLFLLQSPKIPRYVSPNKGEHNIPQVNSSRGRNVSKHLLVVGKYILFIDICDSRNHCRQLKHFPSGNTSKYVGDEEKDSSTNVTHKWLIYIAMKTTTPIESIVSKVRFFLHESYKPNDVVEVR